MKKLKGCIVIPKKVKIQVTRKNIDTGDFGDTKSCAIAKAVKAHMGDHPSVDGYLIEVSLPCGVDATYTLPKKAQNFVTAFDAIEGYNSEFDDDGNYLSTKRQEAVLLKLRRKLKPFTFTATLTSAEINV